MPIECSDCNGAGGTPCPNCGGTGKGEKEDFTYTPGSGELTGILTGYKKCSNCNGTGQIDCPTCDATGMIE